MKIENRLVYIADDGQEFDSEDACFKYEKRQSLSKYIYNMVDGDTGLRGYEVDEVVSIIVNNLDEIIARYNNLYD